MTGRAGKSKRSRGWQARIYVLEVVKCQIWRTHAQVERQAAEVAAVLPDDVFARVRLAQRGIAARKAVSQALLSGSDMLALGDLILQLQSPAVYTWDL